MDGRGAGRGAPRDPTANSTDATTNDGIQTSLLLFLQYIQLISVTPMRDQAVHPEKKH